MSDEHEVMTFECPRCKAVAQLEVLSGGQVKPSSESAGMVYGIDYEKPSESELFHHCDDLPDGQDNVTMRKI